MKQFTSVVVAALAMFAGSVCILAADAPDITPIDLSRYYNKTRADFRPGTSWAATPAGQQMFEGVPFVMNGLVEVTGNRATAERGEIFAGRYTGIPVGRKGEWLHLIHGVGYAEADEVPIARIRLHYENNEQRDLIIRYGGHVRNWWKHNNDSLESLSDPNSKVIWTGTSRDTEGFATLRLFKTSFENPLPDQKIQSLDIQSLFTKATPVIIAMSVGEAGTATLKKGLNTTVVAAERFQTVDLKKHLSLPFSEIDKDPDSAWRYVPHGKQTFDGTPFDLQGTMEVAGLRAARENRQFPTSIRGINVNQRASRLHVLHGAGENLTNGTPLANLILTFADGSKQTLPLVYGQHVRNWYKAKNDADTVSEANSKVVWTGRSPRSDRFNMTLRLYRSSFDLEHTDVELQSIDFVSLMSQSVSVIAGLTLESGEVSQVAAKDSGKAIESARLRGEAVVRVVDGETKKPIGNAQLKFRVEDAKAAYNFGDQKADASGKATLEFPATFSFLELTASAPGYAARVERVAVADIKSDLIVELGPGALVGGLVQDEQKKPIARPEVTVLGSGKDAVGQVISVELDKVTTDATGVWRSTSIPKGTRDLTFKVQHPDYVADEFNEAEGEEDHALKRQDLIAGKAVITLNMAPRIEGFVRNDQKQPVKGANIILNLEPENGAAGASQEPRQLSLSTDEKGFFKFTQVKPGTVTVVAVAKGFGPAKESALVESGVKSIELQLKPGAHFSGLVMEGDKPVAGVAVRPQPWQGVDLGAQTETDSKGEFSWDGGPDEPVLFSFTKTGFQETQIELRPGEKHTVQLGRRFQVGGKVLDADTGEPIKSFTIVSGRVFGVGDDEPVHWDSGSDQGGSGGAYTFQGEGQNFGGKSKIMIRAEGHLPGESPLFEQRGWHEHDFKLKKGSGPAGVVLDANGREVEGADVAVLGAGYVAMNKDGLRQFGQRTSNTAKTDAQGKFSLPALLNSPTIVAVHKSGFALAEKTKPGADVVLLLKPWGRIEGVAKKGTKPAANISVMIAPNRQFTSFLNYDFEQYRTTTGEDGRFVFDRVPPIPSQIVRLTPMENRGWRWNDQQRVEVKSSETTRVTFGGNGRPVIGKLAPDKPGREVDWTAADSSFNTRFPRPPRRFESKEEAEAWNNSPEVKKARETHRSHGVEMSADGSFRVDNVAPGEYSLMIQLREPGSDRFGGGPMLGSLQKEVVVAEIPGGVSDEPIDLGVLTIPLKDNVKVSDMAPDFEVRALEGDSIKLSSYRGKFVLLDFWATWCGPCVAEIPELKAAYDALRKNDKFVLISLSLDAEKKEPIEFTKKREMNWTHGFLGEWSEDKVTKSYGVTGIPAMFLIGPDGKIVARDFRAPNARRVVEQAMEKKTAERN